MKTIVSAGLLVLSLHLFAQPEVSVEKTEAPLVSDDAAVDNYVLHMEKHFLNVSILAKELTENYSTEHEKVRAIFRWITDNISYDCYAIHHQHPYKLEDEISYSMKEHYRYVAEATIIKRKAVCEGYSTLFYELCKAAGIKCYVVHGMANGHPAIIRFFRRIKKFNTNHAWNKVSIDGKWYFVDATWASGSCNGLVTRFRKEFHNEYFLVPDNELYPTHAEEKTESADINDMIGNPNYPGHEVRHPFLDAFYYDED
ncbi:MAG: transglutaminase domain-containing protein [Bacteroidia bacterium]